MTTEGRGLFQAEGPNSGAVPDVMWEHPQYTTVAEDAQIYLSLATANVLTLDGGGKNQQSKGFVLTGRCAMTQAQFSHAECNIIGIQEGRMHGHKVRHSHSPLVCQAGAAADGSRGVELWLDKHVPYAFHRKQPFFFKHEHVHIASFHDRRILAIIRAPHLHIRILVLHAPYERASDCEGTEWWQMIGKLVSDTQPQLPLVILGDMNAKIGSILSDAVSSHGAEQENQVGHLFHAFLIKHGLWVLDVSAAIDTSVGLCSLTSTMASIHDPNTHHF